MFNKKRTRNKSYWWLLALILMTSGVYAQAQIGRNQGHLFIIGGGDRSPELIGALVATADLRPSDYIVILPMATSIPEESIAYISEQLSAHTDHRITSFNFTKADADQRLDWIDSVRHARLIYMTGGNQNKLMEVVRGSKLYDALHEAYHRNGATISGTSAGAAVMSEHMISGAQKGEEGQESGSFREIKQDYAVITQGLGLLTNAIVDQHFIMRSRYNRMLSVLSDHPDKIMIGIDEGTAVIVTGRKARVVGDSQVVVVQRPQKLRVLDSGKASFRHARLSLYTHGDSFNLR